MGDMADWTLEQVEIERFLYRTGELSIEEAYNIGIIDELGFESSVNSCFWLTNIEKKIMIAENKLE